jgi:AraC-like DNA-binding protein
MTGEVTSEYVQRRPAGPLQPFVAGYSGYRQQGVEPARHRGLPSPYLTFIITLDDPLIVAAHPDPRTPPGAYDTLLGGLHTSPALIDHAGRQSGIQVSLSPLGTRSLLGLPAGELASIDVPATDVLGPFAVELRERVLHAAAWDTRFAILDAMLLERLAAGTGAGVPLEITHAWHRLLRTAGAVPVEAIAEDVGWSSRHLRERFGTEIGLGPKAAARVVRFDRARRMLQREAAGGRRPNLAALAATCGYYDQAHLAGEFGAFAGCSPSRWLRDEFRNVQALIGTAVPDSAA